MAVARMPNSTRRRGPHGQKLQRKHRHLWLEEPSPRVQLAFVATSLAARSTELLMRLEAFPASTLFKVGAVDGIALIRSCSVLRPQVDVRYTPIATGKSQL